MDIRKRIRELADPSRVPVMLRFFRTGPGEYAEGDQFIGARVPQLRALCRECRGAGIDVARPLLRSPIHEDRLFALFLLVDAFKHGDEDLRQSIYELYLANTRFINNWDLVDASAGGIVGGWLSDRSTAPLAKLARSASLWERRIAMIATQHFIHQGRLDETFRVADILMTDRHDLIHKASGWMLREAGKRDGGALRRYLRSRYRTMPRTMLRYAVERFPAAERHRYLTGAIQPARAATRSPGRSTTVSSRRSPGGKVKPKP